MSLFDSLQNLDIKRLAQEIVQDTANHLKDEINVGTMLNLLKELLIAVITVCISVIRMNLFKIDLSR